MGQAMASDPVMRRSDDPATASISSQWFAGLRSRLLREPDHRPENWRIGMMRGELIALQEAVAQKPLRPAAILVPIIDRAMDPTLLFTVRAAHLREHAGQVSFPGGHLETADIDALGAALRETEEEVGIHSECVELLGYLPDHIALTGFRITPVVGRVRHPGALSLNSAEVASVFEVPLGFVLDARNYHPVRRHVREFEIEARELPFETHRIWGATAAILSSLCALMENRDQRGIGMP
jgi:8-oxo-dGTP pyrophosphatase MutT (NUDIX family)